MEKEYCWAVTGAMCAASCFKYAPRMNRDISFSMLHYSLQACQNYITYTLYSNEIVMPHMPVAALVQIMPTVVPDVWNKFPEWFIDVALALEHAYFVDREYRLADALDAVAYVQQQLNIGDTTDGHAVYSVFVSGGVVDYVYTRIPDSK